MEKHNEHITTYLDWYLDIEDPEFAVMIKGEWGSGKSYFIKKYIDNKKGEKFIFITLNGLSSAKEIDQQILSEVHPVFRNRFFGPVLKIGGQALAEKTGLSGTATDFDTKTLVNFDKEKYVFVFDDFERHCFEKPHTLMGYINSFVEERHRHVIILSNEDKVLTNKRNTNNGNDKELDKDEQSYEYIKEKVIGQTLTINTPLEHVYKCLLAEMSKDKKLKEPIELIIKNDDVVFEVIKKSAYRNFRVLRQSIQNFGRLFNLIDEKYYANQKFINLLLSIFFTLEIESRMGKLSEDVFSEFEHGRYIRLNDEKLTVNQQKAHDLLNKYNLSTYYNIWVFQLEIWRKWLFEGIVNKQELNDHLKESYLFKNETNVSKLIEFTEMSNEEFNKIMNEIIQSLKGKEITNPSDIFTIYNRFSFFAEQGYDFSTSFDQDIEDYFLEYITILSNEGKIEEDYSFYDQNYTPNRDPEKFKKFKSKIIEVTQKKTIENNKERAARLFEIMKSDANEAGKMIYIIEDEKVERPIRLFEFVDARKFVECFDSIENENKRVIYSKIKDRYRFIHHREWLMDERGFIEESIGYIQKKIDKNNYSPNIFHLERLKIAFEKSIEIMDEFVKSNESA